MTVRQVLSGVVGDPLTRVGSVIIFGELGCGNLGNDGSFAVLLDAIRRAHPGVDVHVIGYGPMILAERYGVAASSMNATLAVRIPPALQPITKIVLRLADFARTFAQVRSARAVIISGAGVFEGELGTTPFGLPLAFWRLAQSCRLSGVPLMVVAVGVSPVHQMLSRRLFSAGLRTVGYASYRDDMSRQIVRDWIGEQDHGVVSADLAMALSTDELVAPTLPGVIAVGVMAGGGTTSAAAADQYFQQTRDLVGLLVQNGCRVRLLIGDGVDTEIMYRLHLALGSPPEVSCHEPATLAEVGETLSGAEVVIATRFHNVVMALKLGLPVVAVSYARKTRELMTEVGLATFCVDVGELPATSLFEMVQQLRTTPRRPDPVRLAALTQQAKEDVRRAVQRIGLEE